MIKKKLYSVTEIRDSIIDEFQLPNGEADKNAYKVKLYRALEETGIKDKGVNKGTGKKKTLYYTEQQKQELLASKELHDYLIDHSSSDTIKARKRYKEIEEEIEQRRNEHISFLDSQAEYDDDTDMYISDNEFISHKKTMMLTALFEKFFTPINEELFLNDLYSILLKDELGLTPENINAEYRLAHPKGNYYEEREDTKEREILNILKENQKSTKEKKR